MSRRDLIIIAVLTNIGLLAVLFMMAVNTDDETYRDRPLVEDAAVSEVKAIEIKMEDKVFLAEQNEVDEVDNLLKVFANSASRDFEKAKESGVEAFDEPQRGTEKKVTYAGESHETLDVTVKKGDVLSKIAAANGTTVSQIKKLNNLTSDQLKVGQTLKIPRTAAISKPTKPLLENAIEALKGEFYVIQSGDNPWKIAKKFSVSVDDLLKMNDMDEKKAKNLKVGQKIRVG